MNIDTARGHLITTDPAASQRQTEASSLTVQTDAWALLLWEFDGSVQRREVDCILGLLGWLAEASSPHYVQPAPCTCMGLKPHARVHSASRSYLHNSAKNNHLVWSRHYLLSVAAQGSPGLRLPVSILLPEHALPVSAMLARAALTDQSQPFECPRLGPRGLTQTPPS